MCKVFCHFWFQNLILINYCDILYILSSKSKMHYELYTVSAAKLSKITCMSPSIYFNINIYICVIYIHMSVLSHSVVSYSLQPHGL